MNSKFVVVIVVVVVVVLVVVVVVVVVVVLVIRAFEGHSGIDLLSNHTVLG